MRYDRWVAGDRFPDGSLPDELSGVEQSRFRGRKCRLLPAKSKGNVRAQENEREQISHCSAQRGVGDQTTKLPPDPTRAAFRGTMVYKCETERERKQYGEQKQWKPYDQPSPNGCPVIRFTGAEGRVDFFCGTTRQRQQTNCCRQ